MCQTSMQTSSSLADELSAATGSTSARPHLVLRKCHPRLRHEDSSPDSERMATDSGHSTAHSPENGPKSVSPIPCNTLQNTDSVSPSSTPGKICKREKITLHVNIFSQYAAIMISFGIECSARLSQEFPLSKSGSFKILKVKCNLKDQYNSLF